MKRNCNNCKALEPTAAGLSMECKFGHPIKETKAIYGLPVSYSPQEECEKPKTYKEYAKIFLEKSRSLRRG